ncbi:MAG: hypothetical protein RLY35_1258 [Bacteroidota bacterium]|jgi:Ca2+-transporting ATPase
MDDNAFSYAGLTDDDVTAARKQWGDNRYVFEKDYTLLKTIWRLVQEPMIVLLAIASIIYFISGAMHDGLFILSAIIFQSAISLYQFNRSNKALNKLKAFTAPSCKVIRDQKVITIPTEEIVIGDYLILEEGGRVAADGTIIKAHDFSVDESILTGESMAVSKQASTADNTVYAGTHVCTGMAVIIVSQVGLHTQLGKIGKSLESIQATSSPLEIQVNQFVKLMSIIGLIVFAVVWVFNYQHSHLFLDSLLQSLTLAMSILPEEIPVAFSTFMALGAWRLMKLGIVVKQMKTVETLGSATVICTDKTGTLTENKMSVAQIYVHADRSFFSPDSAATDFTQRVIEMGMWASEPLPFDPMDLALHQTYSKHCSSDQRKDYHLVHEYPLSGQPPMMTHIYQSENRAPIIACKGAPEAIIQVCQLNSSEKTEIENAIEAMAHHGYRILGIAASKENFESYPKTQQEISFQFLGLVAFYDPPKANISSVIADFYRAGLAVKIITGDNASTTCSIAKQIGLRDADQSIDGQTLMKLTPEELKNAVRTHSIFTRMFPEAKLKIIEALKMDQQVVAMTGDGVNDGPALKAAHIGIAMGTKGSEMAKQASAMILLEDDLSLMVTAIESGRKIYTNLKKAIQYIISIHIPIILTVFIPLVFHWPYPNLFSPIHILFFELIMGPTCSILFEREPAEMEIMQQKPKSWSTQFFNWRELTTSLVQGLVISAGMMVVYQMGCQQSWTETGIRTACFVTLITANIMLTLVNRSFYHSLLMTIRYRNPLVPLILGITIVLVAAILYLAPIRDFFEFQTLTISMMMWSLGVGVISVLWFEIWKGFRRYGKMA